MHAYFIFREFIFYFFCDQWSELVSFIVYLRNTPSTMFFTKVVSDSKKSEMNMKFFSVLIVAAFLVALPCHGSEYQVFPLQMKTGSNEQYSTQVSCTSWRLGVEANNLIKWKTVPAACQEYVADYLLGDQYRSDSKTVCREAYFYAKTLNITARDVFVFDIDDTTLSNLQYFANHGFGYVL